MKKKNKKIRRRCGCKDCGLITNPGSKYILGHYWKNKKHAKESKLKQSLAAIGKSKSDEHKKNMVLGLIGNTNGKGNKNKPKSKEHKRNMCGPKSKEHILNQSISNTKCNPDDEYCDIWRDREYKKDIRKDYCENINCKGRSKKLHNHHIYLDKKRCAPNEVMTLCCSCHVWLHNKLRKYNPEEFIIVNRSDHVSYIHKSTRNTL